MTQVQQTPEERRLVEVLAADAEVRARLPLRAVADEVGAATGGLGEIVEMVMLGYADRPALGERPVMPGSGGHPDRREPRPRTISYREAWTRARSISTAWRHPSTALLVAGDAICSAASASVDYVVLELATIATGAVSVPVAPSAPVAQWVSILAETRPRALAVGVDVLDAVLAAVPHEILPPALIVLGQARPPAMVHQAVLDARRTVTGTRTEVHSLDSLDRAGRDLPTAPLHVSAPDTATEPLAQILYTSGTTGDPKGAMFPERLVIGTWRGLAQVPRPGIVAHHAPMNHIAGRIALVGTLARGGTCYFVGSSDMSTLLEDFSLIRPTELSVVPRVCEILRERFTGDVEARVAGGASREDARAHAAVDLRDRVLGGRVVMAANGSAPLSDDLRSFLSTVLGVPLHDGFGTTEAGGPIMVDNRVLRPQVIDYKLVDVPELGYFGTDQPHPRGELLIKTRFMIPGYHGRPDLTAQLFDADGFYRTGDVMAQTAPDELHFVDRRNNVIKLAQAEFVSVGRIEEALLGSPLIDQIFVHGHSDRSHLVAVVVPSRRATESCADPAELESLLARAIRTRAREADLRSYEVPRGFVVEREPFSVDNGLLSGLGKVLRAKVRDRFDDRLGRLYDELADQQEAQLAAVRHGATDRPVLDTVLRAADALVGDRVTQLDPEMCFVDLGVDSLSALGFSTLLQEVYGVEVPVSMVAGPATSLGDVAGFIEATRMAGTSRPTARSVHGAGSVVRAADLCTEVFLGATTAPPLSPDRRAHPRVVLLTGANGFLGRFVALKLLEQWDCEVICLVRGSSDDVARRRLEQSFDTGDPRLPDRFHVLAEHRLQVIAGDVDDPHLGMSHERWQGLARRVDTIIHPAAQVNHVLPYEQLFGPNVRGTAAVVELALAAHRAKVVFVSTTGIADQVDGVLGEQDDLRASNPVRVLSAAYAAGYATSKWAGEVLLRHAHDRYGLPVTVVRSGLILAHRHHVGQLNLPDMFTRLMLSFLVTGVAPTSFSADRSTGPAAVGGLPVDFLADAVVGLARAHADQGYRTYNAIDPDPDGPTLDSAVDWLTACGASVTRIDDYAEWLRRFEIGLRNAPERIATRTALPLLGAFRGPGAPSAPPPSTSRFRAAVRELGVGGGEIPGLSPSLVAKYVSDLAALGLTGGAR